MQFGVMLNHQYRRDEDLLARIDEGVQTTELLRDLGYDVLLSHHHFLANLQTPQALPVLAHLVPFSGAMRLGIGVYIATLEHPVALAEHFATLDQISGGRLIWGVGAGYREDEFESFGKDLKTRQSRFYEAIEVVTRLWSGEPVTHDGKLRPHPGPDDQRDATAASPTTDLDRRQRPEDDRPRRSARRRAGVPSAPEVPDGGETGNLGVVQGRADAPRPRPQQRRVPDRPRAVHRRHRRPGARRGGAVHRDRVRRVRELGQTPVYRDHYEEMWEKSFLDRLT